MLLNDYGGADYIGARKRLVGWLVFNGTFSTKRLYRTMRIVKVC